MALVLLLCPDASRAQDGVPFAPDSAEGKALAYLKSLPREWSGFSDHDCRTYDDRNLERLKPPFIVAAAAFLRAFVETHGAITINSAHRTIEEQACVCYGEKGPCAGKDLFLATKKGPLLVKATGLSRHQLGIAMDVRPGTGIENEFICLHEFARANPQFGVYFPIGRGDYPHMELIGSRGPAVRVAGIVTSAARITPCQKMKIMLVHDPVD